MDISYQSFKKKRPAWTKTFRRNLEFAFFRLLLWFGTKLSLDQLQSMGRALGKFAYCVLKKDRGIAQYQLEMVFPEASSEQQGQWLKECFLNFGQLVLELVGMRQFTNEFSKRVTVEGAELLDEGVARGKGMILLAPHFGNWELVAPYFKERGHPSKIISKPLYDPRMNDFLKSLRESPNIHLIERGSPGEGIALMRCLKNNEFLYALIDQDVDVKSLFVPFFGIPANTPIGISHLALKTGALVITAIVERLPQGRFVMRFERVGTFEKSKPTEEDLFHVTSCFNQHLESIIRRNPAQWAWFHRRWKRRPSEEQLSQLKEWQQKPSDFSTQQPT